MKKKHMEVFSIGGEPSPWRFDEMTKEQREAHVLEVLKVATAAAVDGVGSVMVILMGEPDDNGRNTLVPFTGQWSHNKPPDKAAIQAIVITLRASADMLEKRMESGNLESGEL